MFWKYIEKINWEKQIQYIPFLENKQLYINIEYKGYTWECGLQWDVNTYFATRGRTLRFTILGILFHFHFHDKRWYNENEGRFYLEDEPRWVDYLDTDYLQRVRDFMQKHPELKEGYYERVVRKMKENQALDENILNGKKKCKQLSKRMRQQSRKRTTELLQTLSFDINKVSKAVCSKRMQFPLRERIKKCFYVGTGSICIYWGLGMIYSAKWDGEGIHLDSFSEALRNPTGLWPLPDIISRYDLYDKKGYLLSKASDYKTHTKYKMISYDCKEATHWYLYDKNGNLLYEHQYGRNF